MHGLFILGPCLVGAFLVARLIESRARDLRREPLMRVFVATVLACLLNPRGIDGALFPVHLFDVLNDPFFKKTIPEATPPFGDAVWRLDTWALAIYGGVALLLQAARIARDGMPRGRDLAFPLVLLAMGWLALPARRNIALFVVWTLPWVSYLAAGQLGHRLPARLSIFRAAGIGGAAAVTLLIAVVTNFWRSPVSPIRFGGGLARHFHPEPAARELARLPIKPVFFSGIHFSDYMLFALPGFSSSLDGRFAEMYPKSHFKRYMDILAHPPEIEREAERFGITGVALELSNPMDQGLVRYLAQAPGWSRYYFDETVAIFFNRALTSQLAERGTRARGAAELVDETERRIDESFSSGDALDRLSVRFVSDRALASAHLSEALILLGETELARRELRRVLALSPGQPLALTLECINQYGALEAKADELTRAQVADVQARIADEVKGVSASCTLAAERGSEREAPTLTLGLLEMHLGKFGEASVHFRAVTERNPTSYQAFLFLGRSYAAQGEASFALAEAAYRRAIALRPLDTTAVTEWANILASVGRGDEARELVRQARASGERRRG
jgi:Flp pilus assembly protein TadD